MSNTKIVMNKIMQIILFVGISIILSSSMIMNVHAQTTGVVSASSAYIREEASTSSGILASVVKNDEVSIAGEVTDASGVLWYQIHVDANTKGYIAASLVTKDGDTAPVTSTSPSENTTTTNTTITSPIATEDEWKSATITNESVRVREDASTSSAVIATVTKGVVVTVTGSKTGTDSMEWYQVSFSVDSVDYLGFIRSDLLTFDTISTTDMTQIEGTLDPNNSEEEEIEETTPEPTETPVVENENEITYTAINTEEMVSVPSGYIEVSISTEDGEVKGWKNGDFYILYATTSTGEEGWYRFDNITKVYQRYLESESMSLSENSDFASSKILIYILSGAVALLFIITIFLILRLSDMKADIEYADEEEYEERYRETYEEDSDIYEEPREIRRNQKADIRLAKELDEVLEMQSQREPNATIQRDLFAQNKPLYEDPEEYLKPDEDDDWDDEFDYIDLDK